MKVNLTQFHDLHKARLLDIDVKFISFYMEKSEQEYYTIVDNDSMVAPHMGLVPHHHMGISEEQIIEAKVYWKNLNEIDIWQGVRAGEIMFREAAKLYPDYPYSRDPEYTRVTVLIEQWSISQDRAAFFIALSSYDRTIISKYADMCRNRVKWRLTQHEKDSRIKELENEVERLKQMLATVEDLKRNDRSGQFRENY